MWVGKRPGAITYTPGKGVKPPICSRIEAAQRVPSPGTAPRGSSHRGTLRSWQPHGREPPGRMADFGISRQDAAEGTRVSHQELPPARGRESAQERSPGAEAALLPAQGTLLGKGSCFFPPVSASLSVSAAAKPTDGLPVVARHWDF